jgi:uncharacterized MAPEG superfamily protein
MLTWILLGLGVHYAGVFLPSTILLPRIGVTAYAGSRDDDPEPLVTQARAQRAVRNMQESLPAFLALSLLALNLTDTNMDQAILGAQLFVVARAVYLPLYVFAVPFLRSMVWTVGFIGLVLMMLALL